MPTNVLVALSNLIKQPTTNLGSHYHTVNRANSMGATLELYVKDLFCSTFNEKDEDRKNLIYNQNFSYLGNQNNPPDIIIKGGDAVEVKKIEGMNSHIALNSSYPKDKLFSDSPMITDDCRNCEAWQEKDLIYVVGCSNKTILKSLWFVYGTCFCANKDVYERLKNRISESVCESENIEFSKTKEIGRVNRVDPLGITYLRIRGMWGIKNPMKIFDYAVPPERENKFSVNVILLKDKYLSFPKKDRELLENKISDQFLIKNIKIKSPNNPAKLLEAKLLRYVE